MRIASLRLLPDAIDVARGSGIDVRRGSLRVLGSRDVFPMSEERRTSRRGAEGLAALATLVVSFVTIGTSSLTTGTFEVDGIDTPVPRHSISSSLDSRSSFKSG